MQPETFKINILVVAPLRVTLFLTFIRATFDLTFFLTSFGLNVFPHALVTSETDLRVLMDFFFLSFSFSMIASPTLSPRLVLPSCKKTKLYYRNEKVLQSKHICTKKDEILITMKPETITNKTETPKVFHKVPSRHSRLTPSDST